LPRYLRAQGVVHSAVNVIPLLASAAVLLALLGNLYPAPSGPYGKLPYIYLAYLAAGLLTFVLWGRAKARSAA
jgi:hypothetical protein